jgi:hypothetical protein
MPTFQTDYLNAYNNLKLTRDDKGVLVAEVHTNGGPCIMTAQSHTEFVDGFYRISQDRANKIVILTGAGGEFITDVDWSSFGNAADPGVWSQVHDEGVQALETGLIPPEQLWWWCIWSRVWPGKSSPLSAGFSSTVPSRLGSSRPSCGCWTRSGERRLRCSTPPSRTRQGSPGSARIPRCGVLSSIVSA